MSKTSGRSVQVAAGSNTFLPAATSNVIPAKPKYLKQAAALVGFRVPITQQAQPVQENQEPKPNAELGTRSIEPKTSLSRRVRDDPSLPLLS